MFDSKQTLTGRLADAIDLVIDFATLGEYGLEPAAKPAAGCERRHRGAFGDTVARKQKSPTAGVGL